MKCKLLVTTKRPGIGGHPYPQRQQVASQPEKGYEILLKSILEEPVVVDDTLVNLKDDPRKCLKTPRQYNGSY